MVGHGLMRRFGLLLLFPLTALAGQEDLGDAMNWLSKMARAAHERSYDGEFVYDDGERLETLRITHDAGPPERERIVSLNGVGREVIRDGEAVQCVFPEARKVYVDDQVPRFTFSFDDEDIARLQRYYRLQVEGRDRVAGRPVVRIRVEAQDEYRYGYRLWLDEETALLLRSELIDPQGEVVERLLFTRLELLDRVPDSALRSRFDLSEFERIEDRPRPPGISVPVPWQVAWLPEGFQLTEQRIKALGEGGEVIQLVFGDGMSLVSVFIEPAGEVGVEGVLLDKGAVHGYALVQEGRRITVVGELPAEAVARIARSVRLDAVAHADSSATAAVAP